MQLALANAKVEKCSAGKRWEALQVEVLFGAAPLAHQWCASFEHGDWMREHGKAITLS
jgi:hypothetical protein